MTVNPKTGETLFTASQAQFEQYRAELEHNLGQGRGEQCPPRAGPRSSGRPTAHSLSPVLDLAAYTALGLDDWTYTARSSATRPVCPPCSPRATASGRACR